MNMAEKNGHIPVDDYAAGKLSGAALAAAGEHLAACGKCREALAALAVPEKPAAVEPLAKPGREPVRVLLPRFASRLAELLAQIGRFGFVIVLTVGTLLLPTPDGLSPEGHRALVALVFTASVLALQPVELPIAALMIPVVIVGLGVGTAKEAFEPFSRPVVFLILSSLFLAEALRKHGLTRRLALVTIVATGGRTKWVLLGLMAIAAGFSMWVENTATAAMLIPVALTISRQVEDAELSRRLLVLMVLGIAYSASLGGMATIMGAASNAVAAGLLAEVRPWRFMDWMKYGLPALVLLFPMTWWLLLRLLPVPFERLDVGQVSVQLKKQGPMTRQEKELLAALGVVILLWVGGEQLEKTLALPPTLLSAAIVGVAVVAYLAVRGVMNWEDIKGVSWGIFLIIGAGLSLGDTLVRTGTTNWLAGLLGPAVTGMPLLVSLIALVLISAVLTNLLNNTTITALFVPVLISIAKSDPGFNVVELVMPVALATTFGYSLPSASGRMALIAASGIVKPGEMMRYGIIMTVASSLALALFFYVLSLLDWI